MASIAKTNQTTEEASSSNTTAGSASVEATAPPAAEAAPQTFASPSEASKAALKSLKEAGTKEEYDAASAALAAAINRFKTELKLCQKAAGLKFPKLTVLKKGQALANTFDGNVYVAEQEYVPVGVSFYDHSGKLHPCSGMDEKEIWERAFDLWKTKMLVTMVKCMTEEEAKNHFIALKENKFKEGYPTDEFRKELKEQRFEAERDVLDKQKQNYSRKVEENFIELHDGCGVAFAFAQDGKVYYSMDSEQLTVYRKWQSFHLKADPEMLYPRENKQRKRGGNGSAKKRSFQPTPKRKNENYVNYGNGTMLCSTRNTNGKGKKGCPVQARTMFPVMEKVIETFFAKRGNEEYKGFLSKQGDFFTELKTVTEPDLRKAFTLTSTSAEPEKKFCARCHVAKLFEKPESMNGLDEPYLISLIVHSANLEVWLKGLRNKSTYKFSKEYELELKNVAQKIEGDTSEYGKRMKLAALFVHFTKYYVRKQKATEGYEMAANWQGYSHEEYQNEKNNLAEISTGISPEPQLPPKRPRTTEDKAPTTLDEMAARVSGSPTNEDVAMRQLGSGSDENGQQQNEVDVQMAMDNLTDVFSDSASDSSSISSDEDQLEIRQGEGKVQEAEGNVEEEEVLLKSVIGYLNKNFNVQNTLKTWHNVKDVLKKEKAEFKIKDLKSIAGLLESNEKLGRSTKSHYNAVVKTMKLRHLNWACRKANVEEVINLNGVDKMTKPVLKKIGPKMYEGLKNIDFNPIGNRENLVNQITKALN